jgi:hypothetical protein
MEWLKKVGRRLIGKRDWVLVNGRKYENPNHFEQFKVYYYSDGQFFGKFLHAEKKFNYPYYSTMGLAIEDKSKFDLVQYFTEDLNSHTIKVDENGRLPNDVITLFYKGPFHENDGLLSGENGYWGETTNFENRILDDANGTLAAAAAAASKKGGYRRTRIRRRSSRRQKTRRNRRQ